MRVEIPSLLFLLGIRAKSNFDSIENQKVYKMIIEQDFHTIIANRLDSASDMRYLCMFYRNTAIRM